MEGTADLAVPTMPVRRLQNFAYCKRLFYLQWVENLFQENADTAEGDHVHRNVDRPTAWKSDVDDRPGAVWRSLALESETLGLRGVIDLVECGEEGLTVVDYKKGHPWRDEVGAPMAKPFDAVQIQAYALLLRASGHTPAAGRVYYAESKQSVPVPVGDEELQACQQLLEEARALAARGACPPPLDVASRCLRCAAYPLCLPGESKYWADGVLPMGVEKLPPRPDGVDGEILVVQDPRARIGIRANELVVERPGEKVIKRPLEQLRAVYLYGAIQVTAQALHAMMERSVSVAHFSPAGRFLGVAAGLPTSGTDARRGQYRLFEQPSARLELTREVVRSKISNQRTLLMRNGDAPREILDRMASLRDASTEASDLDTVRGMEGAAAAAYFGCFGSMLHDAEMDGWDWEGRNRRPPRDPVNALLSLGYSVLASELLGICHVVGLDPYLGFFHQPRYGRPALALDLMEEFRPLIADSVAISLLNRKELTRTDFVQSAKGTFLKDSGRRSFWQAWSRRMDAEVTHPEFGYRMSYRRMLDVQVRQLWRFCRGEAERYHGFTTR
jgi:CRISP-associated protein Cas1